MGGSPGRRDHIRSRAGPTQRRARLQTDALRSSSASADAATAGAQRTRRACAPQAPRLRGRLQRAVRAQPASRVQTCHSGMRRRAPARRIPGAELRGRVSFVVGAARRGAGRGRRTSGERLACAHWLPRRARCCAVSRGACAWRERAGRGWRGAHGALGRLCGAGATPELPLLNCPF